MVRSLLELEDKERSFLFNSCLLWAGMKSINNGLSNRITL